VSQHEIARRLVRASKSEKRDQAIRKVIRQIPRGKVATYGQVAAAAGYPLYHRQAVQVLRKAGDALPWQRVVGAGGQIRLNRQIHFSSAASCGLNFRFVRDPGTIHRVVSNQGRRRKGAWL
jgi:alkylated DNA nucleotide flippase Atl1